MHAWATRLRQDSRDRLLGQHLPPSRRRNGGAIISGHMREGNGFEKGDRMVRLLAELRIFQAVPQGLTTRDLGERMGISQRQAQRDIKALESYLSVPFYIDGNRWVVERNFWLQPLRFSLAEAMGLLLSARLMLRHADHADEFTASAYEKLAAVLPEPIRDTLTEAASGLGHQ